MGWLSQSHQDHMNSVQAIHAHQAMVARRDKNDSGPATPRNVKYMREDEEDEDFEFIDDSDYEEQPFEDEELYEENSAGGAGGATPTNFRRYTPPACVMNSRQQKDPFSRKTGALGNPFAKQPPKNNPFAKKKMTFAPKKTFGANTSYSEPMNNGYSEPKRNNPFAKQKKAFTVTRHDIATCLRYGQNGSQPRKSSMVKIGTTMNQDVERYGEVLPPKVTRGMLAVQRDIATVLSYKKGSKQSRGFGKVREDLSDVRETIDEEEYRQPWNNNGGRKRNSTSVYYE